MPDPVLLRAGWAAARAALRGVPGTAVVPGVGPAPAELPAAQPALRDVVVDPTALARYAKVCGFTVSDRLPVTYPHVLGFPLAIRLMTGADFPFSPLGLVHVANVFTWTRPLAVGERLDLQAHATGLRSHPRGQQFDLVTRALVDGAEVWSSTSTYLRRGGGSGSGDADQAAPAPDDRRTPEGWSAQWSLPGDLGRRYAAVSGDRNPIHLHPLTARLFGFPRAIAHGMWTAARALAALPPAWPPGGRAEVRFRAPILLPATVHFAAEPTGDGWRFDVAGTSGRPHLAGTLTGG